MKEAAEAEAAGSARRPHRAMLNQYYGNAASEAAEAKPNAPANSSNSAASGAIAEHPLNINGPAFDPDMYTQKLIKEASLSQLMAQEAEVVKQIGALDSDMQTLVYENYNKFIAATDTIRKMRIDFRAMEDEMDALAGKMQNISTFSGQITDTLKDRRAKIGELSTTHALLKKLQFLFELPAKLNECIEEDDLATGVKYYLRAQRVLDQYEHMASFKGIKDDCDSIMLELKQRLTARLGDRSTAPEDLSACVDLLLQLNEPADQLCDAYLATAEAGLQDSIQVLRKQVMLASGEAISSPTTPSDAFETVSDILEFVDLGCNTFVSDLCIVIASYNETFLQRSGDASGVDEKMASVKLTSFVERLIGQFLEQLRARIKQEKSLEETPIMVRALDRFHRRLQALSRLLTTIDFSRASLDLVLEASELHCQRTLQSLKECLQESMLTARQAMVAPRRRLNTDSDEGDVNLSELNQALLSSVAEKIRSHLTNLQLFIDPELTFAVKTYFRAKFCRFYVREGVLVAFFSHVIDIAQNFCTDTVTTAEKSAPPPAALLLLLSRTCYDLQLNTAQYLMAMVDEQFLIEDTGGLTSVPKINGLLKTVSQMLLNHYVKMQGGIMSQMLRKSVETRDWLNTVEPRSVRAVMKRVVEEVTAVDRQVGGLYEEGTRKARSSDSSRRTRLSQLRLNVAGSSNKSTTGWTAATSQMDTSLASNIQKMFNERIEIFSAVEFSKVSILTGVVKIALKTLLECVRLRTFSRYGFQQIQVDCHYLNLYLWRFVSDENLVTFLLDEVMTSVVHRCFDPVPMENSVVDMICDRG